MPVLEAPVPPSVLEAGRDARLSEHFAPCFALILQLRATSQFGDPELLRRRITDLLDRSERDAQRAGAPSEDTRQVRFALVAFLDETILASEWEHRDTWMARPLQLEMFDRFDAGEEFFASLEQLRSDQSRSAGVLEVYYLCMALGFKGQYQVFGQEKLRMLIEETYVQLSRQPGLSAVMLSPFGRPRDPIAVEVRSTIPTWVIVVLTLAIGLFAYLGLRMHVADRAGEAAQAIEQAAG